MTKIFDRPPRERAFLSWAYVVLWSGLTFASAPFVRDGVDYVRELWGGEVFTYTVATIVILVAAVALVLLVQRRRISVTGFAWLLGVAGLIVYRTFELQAGSPVEAVHFLQYGILSLLLYRAYTHLVRDYSIYTAVTISGTFVGMIDETIQWMTPGRHFGLQDIWLNLTAVALVQIAVAMGIRPTIIAGWPAAASLRRVCYLGAAAVAYLGLCFLNTPDRIAWYTARVPLLDFIDKRSVMVKFGYLHADAAIGLFRSEMTLDELRRLSRERAEEGARILDRYRDREQYREFLEIYTRVTDPFLHEARVHLFSRDVNLQRARDAEEADKPRLYLAAYGENRILENYFGELLQASSYAWPAELKAEVRSNIPTDQTFESKSGRSLITAYSQQQVFWFFLSAVVGLLLLGRWFGSRARG